MNEYIREQLGCSGNRSLDFLFVAVVVCIFVVGFICYSVFQTSDLVSDVLRVRFFGSEVCKFPIFDFQRLIVYRFSISSCRLSKS